MDKLADIADISFTDSDTKLKFRVYHDSIIFFLIKFSFFFPIFRIFLEPQWQVFCMYFTRVCTTHHEITTLLRVQGTW